MKNSRIEDIVVESGVSQRGTANKLSRARITIKLFGIIL